MESVDDVQNVTDFLGGGWLSIVIGVLAVVLLAWMKREQIKAKREAAAKETDLQRQREQAQTADRNQDLQAGWDEASDDINAIRRSQHEGGEQ